MTLRIALTGATGFLGRHVAARLAADGADVVAVSGDVTEPLHLDAPVDVICHLAGRAGPRFHADVNAGVRVNAVGTLNAVEAARRARARFVLASTCAVYRPRAGMVDERAPLGPENLYAFSKYTAERLAFAYAEHAGVPLVVLRLFNPYGPGQTPEYVIPYLARAVVDGAPLRLRQPDSVRDFVYVEDVADLVARACRATGACLVVNVGSGAGVRIVDVATRLAALAGTELRWEREPAADDPYDAMWADVTTARRELGWTPRVDLETGLRRTLADVRREMVA